ncbi:hypothetical protein D3C86_1441490 [compost metagenome]
MISYLFIVGEIIPLIIRSIGNRGCFLAGIPGSRIPGMISYKRSINTETGGKFKTRNWLHISKNITYQFILIGSGISGGNHGQWITIFSLHIWRDAIIISFSISYQRKITGQCILHMSRQLTGISYRSKRIVSQHTSNNRTIFRIFRNAAVGEIRIRKTLADIQP